jgi:hypothetical protein
MFWNSLLVMKGRIDRLSWHINFWQDVSLNSMCVRTQIKQLTLNLLKPTGYGMHQQVEYFNNCTLYPHCIYVFCICLWTVTCAIYIKKWLVFVTEMKSVYSAVRTGSFKWSGLCLCHLQHKLIGFYNRDEKCLQCGADWVFKWSGLCLCHLQHKLIGFYNRDEKFLQCGVDWVFKWSGLRFIF